MIWLILFIIALGISLFLITPFVQASNKKPALITLFMAGFIASGLGFYAILGTPEEPPQQAMMTEVDIQGMVDGLAARLADEPEDPAGWARLLRSRIVMNDVQALIEDHKTMSAHFADRPEVIEQINQESGFSKLASSIAETEEE